MNLVKKTIGKLEFHKNRLIDLENCLREGKLTIDCIHFCKGEIENAKDNIEYYEEILNVLERKNV